MSKPAFLIDGYAEKEILGELCPGHPIRRIDLNGKNVRLEAIADKVCTLVRLLKGKYYPIIIIVDREDRDISCLEMARLLSKQIKERGIIDNVIVNVPDRMMENWILADWTSFSNAVKTKAKKPQPIEGKNGKGIIKKYIKGYQETTDGARLFINSDPHEIERNSPSFKVFKDSIEKIECKWLKNKQ